MISFVRLTKRIEHTTVPRSVIIRVDSIRLIDNDRDGYTRITFEDPNHDAVLVRETITEVEELLTS